MSALPAVAEEVIVDGDGAAAVTGERNVYFGPNDGTHVCRLYDRAQLLPGHAFHGPAIVEQYDSTIVVPPDSTARVDGYGNLIIVRGQHGNS